MSWKDRVYPEIKLISPTGIEYIASWRGGPRDAERALGVFKSPSISGAIVQDLERGAITYTLTLMFSGEDHDLVVENFFKECGSTKGIWEVIHPVKGRLNLQLISYSEAIEPVLSGNVTIVTTDWIEPRLPEITINAALVKSQTFDNILELNAVEAEQFKEQISQDTFEEQAGIRSRVQKVLDIYLVTMDSLIKRTAEIQARINYIRKQIIENIVAPVIVIDRLAGQIQNLIQIPVKATDNIENAIALYKKFILSTISISPEGIVNPFILEVLTRNQAFIDEIFLLSTLGSVMNITVSGKLTTRSQTISISNEVIQQFETVVDILDQYQEFFEIKLADAQYFSQSKSYNRCNDMLASTLRYLILASFNLKIEKLIILKEPKPPVFIAQEEYGRIGENDDSLNFLIKSNKLSGNDILLLPAGRELKIYL